MKIFAIVVTHNGAQWYDHCFSSMLYSNIPLNIVAIDNASSDNSASYIKEHFPNVHIICNNQNLGFAKANNIGIRYAIDNGADYVFLLNQDAWVEKNTIAELLLSFKECENVGICSPMHLNGSYSGLDERFVSYLPWEYTSDLYNKKPQKYYASNYVNAAAWLISRECIETVGGFDTSLFLHCGEDNNYCQRALYHGFILVINTKATICHDRENRNSDNNIDNQRRLWTEVIRKEEIAEKWSDINMDVPMETIIRSLKAKRILSFFTFNRKRIKKWKEQLEIAKKVKYSRNVNMETGMNWL